MAKEATNIWFQPTTLDELNQIGNNSAAKYLDIKFIEIGQDYLVASMPVTDKVKQPRGLLNGGASCLLAETTGSTAANFCVDRSKFFCVGLEINANHLRSVTDGLIHCKAKAIHLGRKTQVWQLNITSDKNKLICVSRLTLSVLEK